MGFGHDIGNHMAAVLGLFIVGAFIAGGVVFMGGWWAVSFLIEHVTIGWQ